MTAPADTIESMVNAYIAEGEPEESSALLLTKKIEHAPPGTQARAAGAPTRAGAGRLGGQQR